MNRFKEENKIFFHFLFFFFPLFSYSSTTEWSNLQATDAVWDCIRALSTQTFLELSDVVVPEKLAAVWRVLAESTLYKDLTVLWKRHIPPQSDLRDDAKLRKVFFLYRRMWKKNEVTPGLWDECSQWLAEAEKVVEEEEEEEEEEVEGISELDKRLAELESRCRSELPEKKIDITFLDQDLLMNFSNDVIMEIARNCEPSGAANLTPKEYGDLLNSNLRRLFDDFLKLDEDEEARLDAEPVPDHPENNVNAIRDLIWALVASESETEQIEFTRAHFESLEPVVLINFEALQIVEEIRKVLGRKSIPTETSSDMFLIIQEANKSLSDALKALEHKDEENDKEEQDQAMAARRRTVVGARRKVNVVRKPSQTQPKKKAPVVKQKGKEEGLVVRVASNVTSSPSRKSNEKKKVRKKEEEEEEVSIVLHRKSAPKRKSQTGEVRFVFFCERFQLF
jgi:hypothetical protein